MSLGEPREYLKIRRASCLAISCSFSSAFPRSVMQMSRVEARDSADESGAPRSVADDGLTRMNCFTVFSLMTFSSSTINSHLDRLRLRPRCAHPLSIRSMSATTPSGGPPRARSSKYPKVNGDSSCVRIDRLKRKAEEQGPQRVSLLCPFLRL